MAEGRDDGVSSDCMEVWIGAGMLISIAHALRVWRFHRDGKPRIRVERPVEGITVVFYFALLFGSLGLASALGKVSIYWLPVALVHLAGTVYLAIHVFRLLRHPQTVLI